MINELIQNRAPFVELPPDVDLNPWFNICFDLVEPKLRFISKCTVNQSRNMSSFLAIKLMTRLALESGYFKKNSGCHVCLNINQQNVNGYLRLSADNFYRISPFREIFFQNFQNLDNYYIET